MTAEQATTIIALLTQTKDLLSDIYAYIQYIGPVMLWGFLGVMITIFVTDRDSR